MFRIASACALVVLATAAFAQKTEADVRAVYSRMNVLIAKKDVKGLVALFERTAAPDFVSEMNGQTINRAQFAADLKKGMSVKDAPSATSKILSSKSTGDTLIVTIQWHMRGKAPDGKPFAMKLDSVNTWVKTPKGYRLKKIVESIAK